MNKIKILFLFIFLILGGCSQNESGIANNIKPSSKGEIKVVSATNYTQSEYSAYYEKDDYTLSLYEPPTGCYVGAYVLSNPLINFDMNSFDTLTGKPHSTYIYNLRLGEPYPVDWVLKCLSEMKTPHIVIRPPNEYNPFPKELLDETAKEFGEFYTPVFVEFYPVSSKDFYDPYEYAEFFRLARSSFKKHASNVSFVYSLNYEDKSECNSFYPGDEYVDWVGIQMYMPMYSNGALLSEDVFKKLDYIYYNFQDRKPIMISQLAISHYSSLDNTYFSKDSSKRLLEFYERIKNDYSRIKAINYMDFNAIELSPTLMNRDDFSITKDEQMLNAYKTSIQNDYFLSVLNVEDSGSKKPEIMKSAFILYEDENDIYIPENALLFELKSGYIKDSSKNAITIDNKLYYPLKVLKESNTIEASQDNSGKKIILRMRRP